MSKKNGLVGGDPLATNKLTIRTILARIGIYDNDDLENNDEIPEYPYGEPDEPINFVDPLSVETVLV